MRNVTRPREAGGACPAPDPAGLRAAVAAFLGPAASVPSVPLPPDDPAVLLRWLNSWGCRIRYPRAGESDLFGPGVRDWTARWYSRLPGPGTALSELTDERIAPLGACYAELAAVPCGSARRPRPLGPTAAAKLLHGLRPRTLVPWDDAIATRLHGARDADAYLAHQRLNRDWARKILAEFGLGEEALATSYGCPGRPLAKMLDDYAYIHLTRSDTR